MAETPQTAQTAQSAPVAQMPTSDILAAGNGRAEVITPDLQFIRDLRQAGGDSLKKCYQCATCSVTCELAPALRPFPRKEMLWSQWGLKDRLLADPDIFLCFQCNDCSTTCPRGARPGDVLAGLRTMVYRHFSVPGFMGRALADPRALLRLFLVPVIVLGAMLLIQQSRGGGLAANFADLFGADQVVYHHFLKHGILEGLFIGGNILIFLVAFVGFSRYYRHLRAASPERPQRGFLPAAIETVKEIATHRRFGQCGQNRPRTSAHLLVLFGFLGAAATAGLALIYMLVWMAQHPGLSFDGLSLANPIKWLGVASGIALIVGSLMMIMRRAQNRDAVGADGYADKLFLYMIFLVAGTGMLTWLLRLAAFPGLAYPVYFIHLCAVFFLLWYMPYSKFAHMIYRALALTWAHQTGRAQTKQG
jgi:quinone-modifying oxidoreductase subunit QmoC